MSMEKTLKEILDEILDEVEQELEEATTTAGVDGYNTPFAFGAGRKKDKKKEKETATQAGYTIAESVNEAKVHFEKKLKSGNIFQVIDRDTKGMRGTQDKFSMQIVDKKGKVVKHIGSHPSLSGAKKFSNSVNEESYKVAGRPVTLIKGKKSNGTDWKVKFKNGKETSLGDVLSLIKPFPKGITKESVNEAMKPSQVRSAISKVKKGLMRKWKQKGGYENFGQKELSQMKDKFDYNPYGSPDERQISKMLDGFDDWAMNYDGNMREGKKRFKRQDGIGKAKYTISYHDGKKKHKDGSDFFDIKIFKNKKDLSDFVGTLVKQGYKPTNESINEAKVKRPVNRWLELKNDDTMHPHKKMAMGLKELKYQLREVEKFFNWYNKIKTMNELDSQNYWKRTNNHIYTIKEKLIKIAKTIQEIEK